MNSKQERVKFNFIDLIVIITLLAIIGIFVYMLASGGRLPTNKRDDSEVLYTIKIAGVNEQYLEYILVGQEARNSSDGSAIGTITAVTSEKSKYVGTTYTLVSGKPVLGASEYEDLYDVYVTLSSPASVDEKNVPYAGGVRILVGSPVYFSVTSFSHVAYCTSFSVTSSPAQ